MTRQFLAQEAKKSSQNVTQGNGRGPPGAAALGAYLTAIDKGALPSILRGYFRGPTSTISASSSKSVFGPKLIIYLQMILKCYVAIAIASNLTNIFIILFLLIKTRYGYTRNCFKN